MTTFQLVGLGVLELLGLAMMARPWIKRPKPGLIRRVVLSFVLLIPGVGLLLYGFISFGDPPPHGEDAASYSDAYYGSGDSGHGL